MTKSSMRTSDGVVLAKAGTDRIAMDLSEFEVIALGTDEI